jgi:hypothetical protein
MCPNSVQPVNFITKLTAMLNLMMMTVENVIQEFPETPKGLNLRNGC